LGDRYWLAWALNSGGWASRRCGEYEQARPMTEESLALAQKLDHRLTGRALRHLSILDKIAGDLDAATRRLEQAIAIGEEKRYRVGVAKALRSRGELAELQGRFDEAGEFQQRSIALCREIGLPYFLALALEALGRAHAWRGQLDQAHVRLAESRTLFRELELSQNEARVITRQAIVDLWAGAYRSARERAEAARSMTREADARAMVVDAEGLIGGVLGVLGWLALVAGRYEEAWDLCSESVAASPGAGLPYLELEEWSRVGRGLAAMGLGNRVDAQRCIVKAFEGALAKRTFPALLYLMPTAPAWLAGAAAGDLKARAVELYALANSHPFVANSPLFEDIAGRQLKAATAGLPPEVVTEAQERGRALDWWETAGELLDELNA
jgi:tetratricopeptide (TPR) repeat protein